MKVEVLLAATHDHNRLCFLMVIWVLYKRMLISVKTSKNKTIFTPSRAKCRVRAVSLTEDRSYDDVLPGHGHRTPHGAVVEENAAMVEWRLAGET
jgi:hypothetical protein